MKAKLEFDLPEEREDFEYACKGASYRIQIDEIWNQVFRPYYKHGYQDAEFNKLLEDNDEIASQILEKLSELYRNVLEEYE